MNTYIQNYTWETDGRSEPDVQKVLEAVAKKLGIYWGGWFRTIKEPWHFQIALKW